MAIVTDAWPSVRAKSEQLGFLDVIESFLISAEQGCTKPDERMFRPALDAIGVDAGARDLGFVAHRMSLAEASPAPLTNHAQVLELLRRAD